LGGEQGSGLQLILPFILQLLAKTAHNLRVNWQRISTHSP